MGAVFGDNVYRERRNRLRQAVGAGLLLFLGNDDSPMNYRDNAYPFRQDSSFLYYFGLDDPGLAAVLDLDDDREIVFGTELTIDDVVWTGPQPSLADRCQAVGIKETAPPTVLKDVLARAVAQGRPVHFLPPYRAEHTLQLHQLLGLPIASINDRASATLIKAVVAQRSVKSREEVDQIEAALAVSFEMQTFAMRQPKRDRVEQEIAGGMEGLVLSRGMRLAFPTIFSVHGETLHNHAYQNIMRDGQLAVNDSGAESLLHYASDITRTIPVGGHFTVEQREIYHIVLEAQEKTIAAVRPSVEFRDVHRLACRCLVSGLRDLGLMKGDVDDAVRADAHTLFFPCGLGHMLGLDVHDMEGLGENFVGYSDTIKRNPAFGWKSLRLAKPLEPGFVITVEPGIYFIPELLDRWKADRKCADFVNYDRFEKYRTFGGIRIEDDVLITENGHRVLGKPIPKTAEEIESLSSR